jgi:hypothetical protein
MALQSAEPEVYGGLRKMFRDDHASLQALLSPRVLPFEANAPPKYVGDCSEVQMGGYIVSPRFKDFLQSSDWVTPSVEFFPLRLETAKRATFNGWGGGVVLDDFCFMNSYARFDVIDEPSSEIQWSGGRERPFPNAPVHQWRKLALTAYPDADLFGISRMPRKRFVSPRLAAAIKALDYHAAIHVRRLDNDPNTVAGSEFRHVMKRN